MQGHPDAVIMVGPYKPVAEFVKTAKEYQFNPQLITISFVGTENLIKELGPLAEKVIVSQVVPPPDDTSFKIVTEFRDALKKTHPEVEANFVALEGYITTKVYLAGLEKVGKDLTREKLIDGFESMHNEDIGGMNIQFSKDGHQAFNRVFLTQIIDGKAKVINREVKP